MLITLLYMFFTYMQSRQKLRQKSSLKAKLHKIFKGKEKGSVLFCNVREHKLEELTQEKRVKSLDTSRVVCSNFACAKIKESLWRVDDRELYIVHPQQRFYLPQWNLFPQGKRAFPFFENDLFEKKINKSERSQFFIIQMERNLCDRPDPSSSKIRLDDYGLWVAWGVEEFYLYFILETDIDHITDFFITMMQGQYYCNHNNLNITRVLSLLSAEYSMSGIYCEKNCLKNHRGSQVFGLCYNKPTIRQNYDEPIKRQNEISLSLPSKKDDFSLPSKKNRLSFTERCHSSSQKDDSPLCSKDDISASSQEKDLPPILEDNISDAPKEEEKFISDVKERINTYKKKIKPKSPKKNNFRSLFRVNRMICIYAEREQDIDYIKKMLENVLQNPYRYYVFVTKKDADAGMWINDVGLTIVVGNLNDKFINRLVMCVIQGSKVLALCSNMLQTLLPIFKTAEVQENKIVKFSYDKYKNIDLVHDLYCYQTSPVHTRFSQENKEARAPELKLPATIELKDELEESHTFHVTELGREETWQTPSILVVTQPETYGKIVFSQIHLERDPTEFANEERSITALEKSNEARFDIVRDLFETQFEMDLNYERVKYTIGYFLGLVEAKQNMVENLKDKITADGILIMPRLKIQFCKSRTPKIPASSVFLPIMMYVYPTGFSIIPYFDNLRTTSIGRLVIFSEVIMSSMYVIGTKLEHGLAVITRQQTRGHKGQWNETWLGPKGCAMFSVQVHIPKNSCLGRHITILQHVVTVAIIKAVRERPGYENIPLRLKWPNKIYTDKNIKIGSTIVTTQLEDSMYICNIAIGVNLDNDWPTTCINDLIVRYNEEKPRQADIEPLERLKYEEFIASVFNELELQIIKIQTSTLPFFRDVYCAFWIHQNAEVSVTMECQSSNQYKLCKGRIMGINEDGFLLVLERNGEMQTVHPDENIFDSLKGIIIPRRK